VQLGPQSTTALCAFYQIPSLPPLIEQECKDILGPSPEVLTLAQLSATSIGPEANRLKHPSWPEQ